MVPLNPSLPRLVGNVAGNKASTITNAEALCVESVVRQLLEAQSVFLWFFNAVLAWLKEQGFVPSEATWFKELIQAFSLSVVNASSSSALLSAFF